MPFCLARAETSSLTASCAHFLQDPLFKLNDDFGKFESDKKKFISLIEHQTQKRNKLQNQIQTTTDQIVQTRADQS